jgi:uncharacterized DUF497 family protein
VTLKEAVEVWLSSPLMSIYTDRFSSGEDRWVVCNECPQGYRPIVFSPVDSALFLSNLTSHLRQNYEQNSETYSDGLPVHSPAGLPVDG